MLDSTFRNVTRRFGALATFGRRKPLATVGLVLLAAVLMSIVLGPVISPHGAYEPDSSVRLQAPNVDHWAGTDEQGRDTLTRVLVAGRYSFTVGVSAALGGMLISVSIGLISGYAGGITDLLIQRLVDAVMAIPFLLFLLLLMSVAGVSMQNVIAVVGIYIGITQSRVVRSAVLETTSLPFVEAARSLGASPPRILLLHVWPSVRAPVIIITSLAVASGILAESSLSFLGYGVPPPEPTWGQMIGVSSLPYLRRAPWLVIAPGIILSMVVFSVSVLGDGLRDILDPRLRGGR